MKKRMLIAFAAALMMSTAAMAQDTMKQGDQMKHDNMKADNMSKKAASFSRKVSDDGKMFVSDKDNKSFTVGNPEALKGMKDITSPSKDTSTPTRTRFT